jgi:hypothetical protein
VPLLEVLARKELAQNFGPQFGHVFKQSALTARNSPVLWLYSLLEYLTMLLLGLLVNSQLAARCASYVLHQGAKV